MPDVEWIMENCHMMRDNGVWAGEKQQSKMNRSNRKKLILLAKNRKRLRLKLIPRKCKLKLKRMLASSKQKVKPRLTKLSQIQSQIILSV